MQKFKIIIVILIFNITNLFNQDIITFAPFNSSTVERILITNGIKNYNGGYLLYGYVIPKNVDDKFYPTGLFIMNLIPDNIFILDYHKGFYKEVFLNNPISPFPNNSTIKYNSDSSITLVSSWNQYFNPSIGTAGVKVPYLFNFNTSGKLISSNVDTISDKRNNQIFGAFPPIVFNGDDGFVMFNYSSPDSIFYLFASLYNSNGDLIERKAVIEMLKDTIGDAEKLKGYYYEPKQVIKSSSGDYFLSCDRFKKLSDTVPTKQTAVILAMNSEFKLKWLKEFSYNLLDYEHRQVQTLLTDMLINDDNSLLIYGYHILFPNEIQDGNQNRFVYYLDQESSNIQKEIIWTDSTYFLNKIIQTEDGNYLGIGRENNRFGTPFFSDSNEYNFAVIKYNPDFKMIGKYTNTNKTQYNDMLYWGIEHSKGVYDMFGIYNNEGLFIRLEERNLVSVLDNKRTQDLFLFPNPTQKQINISIDEIYYQNLKIAIYNLLGIEQKEIEYKFIPFENTISVDVSDLLSGAYFIVINEGESFRKQMFIKE